MSRIVKGVLTAAFAVEAAMLAYTWAVPDIYTDYAISSCRSKGNGKAEITGIGKDGDTYRQRRFNTTMLEMTANAINCSNTPLPELSEQSMSCTVKTRGQYIPLVKMWPYVDEEGADCKPVTPEQLKGVKDAIARKEVSQELVIRMMK